MSILDMRGLIKCPRCNKKSISAWYFSGDCRGNPDSSGASGCSSCGYYPNKSFISKVYGYLHDERAERENPSGVIKSLDYYSIPRREASDTVIEYDRDIDMSAMMMNRVPPLYDGFLSARSMAVAALDGYNKTLEKRITYIAESICKTFDCKLSTWYFPNAGEGEVGDYDKSSSRDSVHISIEHSIDHRKKKTSWIILLDVDGAMEEYDLTYEFPKRWLTEDFEYELSHGSLAYLQKLQDEVRKNSEKLSREKEEEKALMESIKKKLTPSELRLLNRTK